MGMIQTLAVLGTLVSTLIVGYGLYLFETLGIFELNHDPLVALLFSSLISAVDPVATLAVFSSLKVDRVLYAIVFGESVLNDAVSISLYQTFLGFISNETFSVTDLFKALGLFVGKFVGAFFVGIIVAGIMSFMMKHMKVKEPTLAISMITMTGYFVYSLCEGAKLSGIVGLLFCAITMKHYAFHNISELARHGINDFLHTVAYLAEVAIYIYLGMAFFVLQMEWSWPFIGLSLFLCLFARLCHVFPISWIANIKRRPRITLKFQFVIWFSGLRGAIAFALVLLLPEIPHKQMLVSSTLVIVVVTTFLIGGSTKYVLNGLNIKMGDFETVEDKLQEKEVRRRPSQRNSFVGKFRRMDKQHLMPFLTRKTAVPETLYDQEFLEEEEDEDGFLVVSKKYDDDEDLDGEETRPLRAHHEEEEDEEEGHDGSSHEDDDGHAAGKPKRELQGINS